MVLDGLAAKRLFVSIQIAMPPLAISFGVVDLKGENRISLFQLVDPTEKKFVVEQLGPESDTVNETTSSWSIGNDVSQNSKSG